MNDSDGNLEKDAWEKFILRAKKEAQETLGESRDGLAKITLSVIISHELIPQLWSFEAGQRIEPSNVVKAFLT